MKSAAVTSAIAKNKMVVSNLTSGEVTIQSIKGAKITLSPNETERNLSDVWSQHLLTCSNLHQLVTQRFLSVDE